MRAVAHVDKDSLAVHAHAHTEATVAVGCDSTATEDGAEGGCKGLFLQLCDSCNLDEVRGNTSRRGIHATAAAVCLQQQLLVAATATCVGLWIATMPCDHICTCPSTSQQQPSSAC